MSTSPDPPQTSLSKVSDAGGASMSSGGAVIDTGRRGRTFVPEKILPFVTTEHEARVAMRALIRDAWLAPAKVSRAASSSSLNALYLPFWSFDAHSVAHWDRPGLRGILEMDFRNMLVCAAHGFESRLLDALQPFPARSMLDYDERHVAGSDVAPAQISFGDTALRARIRAEREMLVTAQRGQRRRDRDRIQLRGVEYTRESLQPILLPVWTLDYTYLSRPYRIAVNGATGKAAGRVPMSVVKALLLALAALSIYLLVEGPRLAAETPAWVGESAPDALGSLYSGQ